MSRYQSWKRLWVGLASGGLLALAGCLSVTMYYLIEQSPQEIPKYMSYMLILIGAFSILVILLQGFQRKQSIGLPSRI